MLILSKQVRGLVHIDACYAIEILCSRITINMEAKALKERDAWLAFASSLFNKVLQLYRPIIANVSQPSPLSKGAAQMVPHVAITTFESVVPSADPHDSIAFTNSCP